MSAAGGSPPVAVAVVSWNTRELLLRCLRSLAAEVEAGRAAVWVVDNGSTDGSAEAARREAPWATVLEPGANLGFGRAVNLVARQTDAEWIAAANADVALGPGALGTLLAAAGERIGCLAPRLVLPSGETQHSVYPFPTVPFTLAFNLSLHRLRPHLADRLCLEGFWDPDRPRAVPWAIGALLLLRRAAFAEVGGFDESQWMYAEDLDLGWRLRERGWITWYEPSARVAHDASAATSAAFGPDRRAMFMGETYATIARRRGVAVMWTVGALNVTGAAVRAALYAPLAVVSRRWAAAGRVAREWLGAHARGLRHAMAAGQRRRRAAEIRPPTGA